MWPMGVLAWVNSGCHQQLIRQPWGTSLCCEGSREESRTVAAQPRTGTTWAKCGLHGSQVGSVHTGKTALHWFLLSLVVSPDSKEILSARHWVIQKWNLNEKQQKPQQPPATEDMPRWLHSELLFSDSATRKPAPDWVMRKKIVIRGYGRAAFDLSPADYIPGRHCEATLHAHTRTSTHRHLISAASRAWALGVFFPPSSFCHHSRWLEAGCLYAPARTSPTISGSTNKQKQSTQLAMVCVRKQWRLRRETV